MAEVMLTKKVLFIGAWRAVTLTDYLQRTIVDQLSKKKGFPSKLNITSKGMELYMVNNKKEVIRTEALPLENIKDFTINKYQPMCVLVTVTDSDKYVRIFVFLCAEDRDAAHLVQVYGQAKKSLSGEGYNFNLKTPHGQNWTLKESPGIERKNESQFTFVKSYDERIRQNGNVKHMHDIADGKRRVRNIPQVIIDEVKDDESFRILNDHKGGRMFYDVAVQTDLMRDHDVVSTSTEATSTEEIKDDLVQLSHEVKAIKLMLEEAREVSKTQYFRRSQIQETSQRQDKTWEPVIVTQVERPQPNQNKQHGPGLGLSYVTVPSHDARSYGTQTIYKQNPRATKNSWSRMPRRDQALYMQQSSRSFAKDRNASNSLRMGFTRRRYDSENPYSSVESNQYMRKSRKRPAVRQMSGSSTIPGSVVVHTARPRSVILSSTIPRNIEDVYKHQSIGRSRPKSLVMSDYAQQEGILTTDTGDILRADDFEEVVIGGQSVIHTANQPKDVAMVEFPPTTVAEFPETDAAVVEFTPKEETVVKVGQGRMVNGDFSHHEETVNDERVMSTEIHVGYNGASEVGQNGDDGIQNEIDVILNENKDIENGVGMMVNGNSEADSGEERRESGDGGSGDNSPKDDSNSIKKEITLITQNYFTRVK